MPSRNVSSNGLVPAQRSSTSYQYFVPAAGGVEVPPLPRAVGGMPAGKHTSLLMLNRACDCTGTRLVVNRNPRADISTGHHCAPPILRRMGVEQSVRPSFTFSDTFDEIDVFLKSVRRIAEGSPLTGPTPHNGAGRHGCGG